MQVCSILMMLLNNPMSDSVVEYVAVGELLHGCLLSHYILPPTITPFRRIFSNGANSTRSWYTLAAIQARLAATKARLAKLKAERAASKEKVRTKKNR